MTHHAFDLTRRSFLQAGAAAAASLALGGSICSAEPCRYGPALRDRLWMWGHGAGSTDGQYNIPPGTKIDMADAIRSMGIPNVCVIRWRGLPEPPFDDFIRQFKDVKRVAWSVIDGAPQSFEQKKRWDFELLEKLPNLASFYLDDFFRGTATPKEGETLSPAHLSLDELRQLKREMDAAPRKPELACVLYSNQLQPGIRPYMELCDTISFWTWKATDLTILEKNFARYRELVPEKPTLLGIYMWDFGNSRPITPELMKLQLEFALEKFKSGQIDGMIFHCTPLCDRDLQAVSYSRKWIAEHAEVAR